MKSKLIKRITFIIILVYAIITFLKQQTILNSYAIQSDNLNSQIAEAKSYQEELNLKKESISSPDYLEAIAREKLGMYMPNERVYIDNENY